MTIAASDLHVFDATSGAALSHGLEAAWDATRRTSPPALDRDRPLAMPRDLLIGVDAGTSVIKAVAFTLDGEQVGLASGARTPMRRTGPGQVEQDMAGALDCARTDVDASSRRPRSRICVAVRCGARRHEAQGDGTWLIDDDEASRSAAAWLQLEVRPAGGHLRGLHAARPLMPSIRCPDRVRAQCMP